MEGLRKSDSDDKHIAAPFKYLSWSASDEMMTIRAKAMDFCFFGTAMRCYRTVYPTHRKASKASRGSE